MIMCTYNTIQLNTPTTPQPGFVSLQFFVAISSRIVVIIREIIMNQSPRTRHSSVDISSQQQCRGRQLIKNLVLIAPPSSGLPANQKSVNLQIFCLQFAILQSSLDLQWEDLQLLTIYLTICLRKVFKQK